MKTNNFAFRLSLLSGVLCLTLLPIFGYPPQQHSWTYSGETGPNSWGTLDPKNELCSAGRSQSPIDIKDAKTADLPGLKFDYKTAQASVIDNGHTIQVNYDPGSSMKVGNETYSLRQFHFHYPSEEHVKGQAYDMVAHIVHADAEGRLAVVAVLLKQGDTNQLIDLIWKNIPREKGKAVTVTGAALNAADLLPTDHGYYTFAGSLTTPPCSEGVTWYVMKAPVTLSTAQVAFFKALYPMNARPIQPTNGRQILQSK